MTSSPGPTVGSRSGLVTLGETLGLFTSGPLAHAATTGTVTVGIGGAESNVAIGVRRLGGHATWIGRVGNDSLGTRILRELRAEDLTLHAILDPDVPTALMLKESHPGLNGTITRVTYHRADHAGSRITPDDLTRDGGAATTAIAGAGVLHLTGITPGLSAAAHAAVTAAVEIATDAGVPISFDVNHRDGVWRHAAHADAHETYRDLAAAATIVFAGEDEARLLTGTTTTDPDALLAELAATTHNGTGGVVLKQGEHGCLALIAGTRYDLPAVRVRVVDTVGAGDAFVAGYLADLLAGAPAEQRLVTAVHAGAYACLAPGDWESLPTRADLATLTNPATTDPVTR